MVTRHILVVDDDPFIRKLFDLRLRHAGFTLTTAASGQEALALDLATFDAILCDFTMPGMTGVEVLAHFRGRGLRTPFVLISATHEPDGVPEALATHNADFMTKPLDLPKLIQLLEMRWAAGKG